MTSPKTTPRGPGKPRLREGEDTVRVTVPIARSDRERLRRAASRAGVSLAAYIRRAALESVRGP